MNPEIIIASVITFFFLIVNVFWSLVFTRKIYLIAKYRKTALRNITEDSSDHVAYQFYNHYTTDIRKYSLLLLINIIEAFLNIFYYMQILSQSIDIFLKDTTLRKGLENCSILNDSMLIDFQYKETFQLLSIVRSFGQAVDLCVPGLGICLMNFLIWRMKNMDRRIMNMKGFIFILSVICLFIVLTSHFPAFYILTKIVFLSAVAPYSILFLIHVRRFKRALLQTAMERLVQHGSNASEMKQYRFSSCTMNCISSGMCLIVFAFYFGVISRFMITFIFFSRCHFPLNLFRQNSFATFKRESAMNIFMAFYSTDSISSFLAYIGVLLLVSPLILFTIFFWITYAYKKTRGKSSMQFRFRNST